jgi:hypothetical protein
MRQVPDPERAEWIARMRERARLDADALVPRPPFDVYGLAAPPLRPMALGELVQSNDEWETIGLSYGDWAHPGPPGTPYGRVAGRADTTAPGGRRPDDRCPVAACRR